MSVNAGARRDLQGKSQLLLRWRVLIWWRAPNGPVTRPAVAGECRAEVKHVFVNIALRLCEGNDKAVFSWRKDSMKRPVQMA